MLELRVEPRTILGKKVNSLRRAGFIPAILYGHNKKPMPVTVAYKEFDKVFKQAGGTTLLQLVLNDKKHNVFIHDFTKNTLSGQITHVDFFEVKMDEKIKAKVPFIFIGESPAVKADNGILVRVMQELEIEALPQYLPREIKVDTSSLKTFDDKIHVRDIFLGGSIKILAHDDEIIALVSPPRSDKEMAELESKPAEAIGEIKVVGEEEKLAAATEAQGEDKPTK